MSNVPQRVANADNTSGTFWSATPGHTTNSMGFSGPGTASSCSYREGTTPPRYERIYATQRSSF